MNVCSAICVECCDGTMFNTRQCGSAAGLATWDGSMNPGGSNGPAQNGLQCLIHTTSNGQTGAAAQQDTLDPANFKASTGAPQISPGSFSQSRYSIPANAMTDTSDSIITVPIFHVPPGSIQPNSQVTVVGFLQLFVNWVGPGASEDMNAFIVNVIGCGTNTASGAPVSGGGVSPIPVRLIHN